MSLNKSVPQPQPQPQPLPSRSNQNDSPDYTKLVRFLVEPFLESPNSLSVDCEMSNSNSQVWIRLAFEGEDKGRVFGRGGRNIQAIRTAIEAAALCSGQSVYLDIYGGVGQIRESDSGAKAIPQKSPPRRPEGSRPASPIRTRQP